MTRTLILLFAFLMALNSAAQNFEGQITYHNSFKSKMPAVTDQQWATMMGTTQDYFIQGGNYRSNTNGTMLTYQLYINNDNKLYNKLAGSEALLWNDGAVNQDEVLHAEMKNNATEILGYTCHELVLTCKSGVQKYYFAPALRVDSSLFAKHKYGNWSAFISRAGALPLKIVVDNAQFTMESLAATVKPRILEDDLFVLPPDAKTTKSPY